MTNEIMYIGVIAVPIGITISIIIATWYYNRNYYLKTKAEFLKIKTECDLIERTSYKSKKKVTK